MKKKKWKSKLGKESDIKSVVEWSRKNKKWLLLSAIIVFLMFIYLTGYSSGQKSLAATIEEQETEIKQKDTETKELSKVVEQLEKDVSTVRFDSENIQKEYEKYKKRMEPYEELEEADAELKRVEAEKQLEAERKQKEEEEAKKKAEEEEAKKKAEEEEAKKKAAEEAKQEEEERRGYETGITYDQLARTPEDYIGEKVKFSGKVVQVLEGDGYVNIRFAVNDDYDTVLIGEYDSSIVSSRILEDDYITVYGTSLGLYTYEATMGQEITIPSMVIDRIDQ